MSEDEDESKAGVHNACPYTVAELGLRAERILAVALRRYNDGEKFVELDIEPANISSIYPGSFGERLSVKGLLLELVVVTQELFRKCARQEERCDRIEDVVLRQGR